MPADATPQPARPTVACAACEPGRTVIRVTLDRKCVVCGRPVSDEPWQNDNQRETVELARAKCLEVERTFGASEVATMASLACFGALVLAERSPWVRHHVVAIHALVDAVAKSPAAAPLASSPSAETVSEQEQDHLSKTENGQLESRATRDATCRHCWHQWGPASATISTTGTAARGTNRCCHCGEYERYDYNVARAEPRRHGQFFYEIMRNPI